MTKKFISVFLVAIMIIILPLGVSAETTVNPRYSYVAEHYTSLSISNNVASVVSVLHGNSLTTSIKITLTLQKKVLWWWDDVTEWSDITPSNSLTMSESTTVGSGTYRAKMVALVCSGTESETIEGYSSEKTN